MFFYKKIFSISLQQKIRKIASKPTEHKRTTNRPLFFILITLDFEKIYIYADRIRA